MTQFTSGGDGSIVMVNSEEFQPNVMRFLGWAPNAWRPLRRSSGLPDDLDTHEHPVLIEIKIHIGAFILPNQVEQSNAL